MVKNWGRGFVIVLKNFLDFQKKLAMNKIFYIHQKKVASSHLIFAGADYYSHVNIFLIKRRTKDGKIEK